VSQEVVSIDPWSDWLLHRRHGGDAQHEKAVRAAVEKIRDRVLDGAALSPGMLLVDVGSGDGLIAFGALARVGPSLRVELVDVSAALLKRAQERAAECAVGDRCKFLQTSAEQLDGLTSASADVVTTRAVLAYIADKVGAIRQFYRVLKPGGRVSIGEPIYRDEAIHLATVTNSLRCQPIDLPTANIRLWQRCRAAQLPSTMEEIQSNALTNFSERDLLGFFQTVGFTNIHLELHIDISTQSPIPWETFIDSAPRPGAPTPREILAANFSPEEQQQYEQRFRPLVESGQLARRDTIAYLTATKPN
jgi:arsenite methyltransferase